VPISRLRWHPDRAGRVHTMRFGVLQTGSRLVQVQPQDIQPELIEEQ